MSANIYLNRDKTEGHSGFTFETKRGQNGEMEEIRKIFGQYIHGGIGAWWLMVNEEDDVFLGRLEELIEKISLYSRFPKVASRETGVYRHDTAEGKLEIERDGKRGDNYIFRVTGETMGDIFALLHAVKVGYFPDGTPCRPEESYEGPQSGRSRAELEAQVARLNRNNEALEMDLAQLRERFEGLIGKIDTLHRFVRDLFTRTGLWPYVNGDRVAQHLSIILNAPSPPSSHRRTSATEIE